MTKRGWARCSFKVGDTVTVNLQPVKNGAPIGRLRNVVLPDGSTLTARGPAPAAAAPPASKTEVRHSQSFGCACHGLRGRRAPRSAQEWNSAGLPDGDQRVEDERRTRAEARYRRHLGSGGAGIAGPGHEARRGPTGQAEGRELQTGQRSAGRLRSRHQRSASTVAIRPASRGRCSTKRGRFRSCRPPTRS